MAAVSVYLANALLNEVLRNINYAPPANVYLACYESDPTNADTGTEVTGGSYARPVITFAAPNGGTSVNDADVAIAGMPAVSVTHVGVRDAAVGGNLLFFGPLSAARNLSAGDTFIVRAGDLNAAFQ